jgi:hypothetical protein
MKFRIDALNIRQRYWFVEELFVERKREARVEAVTVEDSDA